MPSAAASAPNYDDVRWPAKGGLRVPQEAGSATLDVSLLVTANGNGASALTLNSSQVNASVLLITNMSATANNTVSYPVAFPGMIVAVKNSSGSACTVKVAGATGVSIANGSHMAVYCNTTDIEQYAAAF